MKGSTEIPEGTCMIQTVSLFYVDFSLTQPTYLPPGGVGHVGFELPTFPTPECNIYRCLQNISK